jgi:O-antigen/teichoic acid export membrane protein
MLAPLGAGIDHRSRPPARYLGSVKPFQAEVPAGSGAAPGRDSTRTQPGRLVQRLDQGTVRAVGLALAAMVANLVAVLFTVAFTRLLGADEYGDLAALLNVTITLFVPGYALQVAVARAGTAGRIGGPGELSATLARWTRQLTVALVAVAALSVLLREQLAAALNLSETWAVAALPAAAAGWLLVCLQRGLLQAAEAYRAVGVSIVIETVARLLVALVLVATGAGVTAAYLGTVIAVVGSAAVLSAVLRRRLGPGGAHAAAHSLRELTRDAAVPIVVLTLLAALRTPTSSWPSTL